MSAVSFHKLVLLFVVIALTALVVLVRTFDKDAMQIFEMRYFITSLMVASIVAMLLLFLRRRNYDIGTVHSVQPNYQHLSGFDRIDYFLERHTPIISIHVFGAGAMFITGFSLIGSVQCFQYYQSYQLWENITSGNDESATTFKLNQTIQLEPHTQSSLTNPLHSLRYKKEELARLIALVTALLFYAFLLPYLTYFSKFRHLRRKFPLHNTILIIIAADVALWLYVFLNESGLMAPYFDTIPTKTEWDSLPKACLEHATVVDTYRRSTLIDSMCPLVLEFMLASTEILIEIWFLRRRPASPAASPSLGRSLGTRRRQRRRIMHGRQALTEETRPFLFESDVYFETSASIETGFEEQPESAPSSAIAIEDQVRLDSEQSRGSNITVEEQIKPDSEQVPGSNRTVEEQVQQGSEQVPDSNITLEEQVKQGSEQVPGSNRTVKEQVQQGSEPSLGSNQSREDQNDLTGRVGNQPKLDSETTVGSSGTSEGPFKEDSRKTGYPGEKKEPRLESAASAEHVHLPDGFTSKEQSELKDLLPTITLRHSSGPTREWFQTRTVELRPSTELHPGPTSSVEPPPDMDHLIYVSTGSEADSVDDRPIPGDTAAAVAFVGIEESDIECHLPRFRRQHQPLNRCNRAWITFLKIFNIYTALLCALVDGVVVKYYLLHEGVSTSYLSRQKFDTDVKVPTTVVRIFIIGIPGLIVVSHCFAVMRTFKEKRSEARGVRGSDVVLILAAIGAIALTFFEVIFCWTQLKHEEEWPHKEVSKYMYLLDAVEQLFSMPQILLSTVVIRLGQTRQGNVSHRYFSTLQGALSFLTMYSFGRWVINSFLELDYLIDRVEHRGFWKICFELFAPFCIYFRFVSILLLLKVKRLLRQSASEFQKRHHSPARRHHCHRTPARGHHDFSYRAVTRSTPSDKYHQQA